MLLSLYDNSMRKIVIVVIICMGLDTKYCSSWAKQIQQTNRIHAHRFTVICFASMQDILSLYLLQEERVREGHPTPNYKAAKLGFFLGDMYCILLPGDPAKDSPRLKTKVRDTDTGTREKTRIRRQKPGEKGKGARKLQSELLSIMDRLEL